VDKEFLVSNGQRLVELLDGNDLKPRSAVWVHTGDTDAWRLWIEPWQAVDRAEFYRKLAAIISNNRERLPGFDIGSVEMKTAENPIVKGLHNMLRLDGVGNVHLSNNRLNGVFLPDGIVLRMAA